MTDKRKIYRNALIHFGIDHQQRKCVEEIVEALEAMLKHRENKDSEEHVCEELADAIIMLEQMAEFYDWERVQEWKQMKLDRLTRTMR